MSDIRTSKNLKTMGPLVAAGVFGLLMAGCAPASSDQMPSENDMSSSAMMSSSSAMMQSSEAMMSSSAAMMSSSAKSTASNSVYADGTYSAEGVYRSPAGGESVHVTLVLKDDVVTGVTFKGDATNPKSITMQGQFGAGINEAVVGKSLDDVSVGVVNGSSLTGTGFMEAVTKIKAEAKA